MSLFDVIRNRLSGKVSEQKKPIPVLEDVEYGEFEVWQMRDGKKVFVSDMSTRHIHNTIKMLQRRIAKTAYHIRAENWILAFTMELQRRIKEEPTTVVVDDTYEPIPPKGPSDDGIEEDDDLDDMDVDDDW